jgi:hypothetical protein
VLSSLPMKAPGFSLTPPGAALLLALSAAAASLGCSSVSSHVDGGGGGASAGIGGTNGGAGTSGAGGSVGGRSGTTDAAADLRADVRSDVRGDVSGAGGMIVFVDASGNTLTCAQLLTCCNSIPIANLKTMCLAEYAAMMPNGNAACGNVLAQIQANGACL